MVTDVPVAPIPLICNTIKILFNLHYRHFHSLKRIKGEGLENTATAQMLRGLMLQNEETDCFLKWSFTHNEQVGF